VSQDEPVRALTSELRDLVWGLRSEVEVVTALSARIDDRVQALNALRAEAARRFEVLDALLDAADDPRLRRWLEGLVQPVLPQAAEVLPDRLSAHQPGP
jgi:septal ring factor EnvC (AmiA/AmiB activator)